MGGIINAILFQPPQPPHPIDRKVKVNWVVSHDVKANADVRIPVVYFAHKGSPYCILHSHGNATDLGQMIPYLLLFKQFFRINVCAYEYHGYGMSSAVEDGVQIPPSEEGVFSAIQSTLTFLSEEKGLEPKNIILFGTSMGSGPTCHMASQLPFRGVVIQSGFISALRTKLSFLSPKLTELADLFVNYKKVGEITAPLFVIHGKRDDLVPFDHGEQIFRLAQNPYEPLWVEKAGHNNVIESCGLEIYLKRIFEFLIYLDRFHGTEPAAPAQRFSSSGIASRFSRRSQVRPLGADTPFERPTVVPGSNTTRFEGEEEEGED